MQYKIQVILYIVMSGTDQISYSSYLVLLQTWPIRP